MLLKLVNQQDFRTLETIANQKIIHFNEMGNIDSLSDYIHYAGIAIVKLHGINAGKN